MSLIKEYYLHWFIGLLGKSKVKSRELKLKVENIILGESCSSNNKYIYMLKIFIIQL